MNYNCHEIVKATEAQLKYFHDTTLQGATPQELHDALGKAVMIAIKDNWNTARANRAGERKAFYISAEYLMGRMVYSNLYSLGILDEVKALFAEQGVDLAVLEDIEDDALGNGGLGRLAACFLDSAASCDLPLSGYGLRYQYGLFKQSFDAAGNQVETPDDWTAFGDPWSYRRDKQTVLVHFGNQTVKAVPYDMPVIGYGTQNIGTLRLWQAEPMNKLNFGAFNAQDYIKAVEEKIAAERITDVLYPNDNGPEGKALRVKQQYFLSSASIQDMMRNFKAAHPDASWDELSNYCAVQLNDTHPVMSIPELIRLLMIEGLSFDHAFSIAQKTFSYTNHTVLSEALEKWDLALLRQVVPAIADIICKIDHKCREEFKHERHVIDKDIVHMADLAIYVGSYVNGVAEIHSQILKDDCFKDWYAVYPERFQNKTNGITPRRWLGLCNPELTGMLRKHLGHDFLNELGELANLKANVSDEMVAEFNAIKRTKKEQLCKIIAEKEGVQLNPDFMFDIQVKRLHMYKRQLMNALSIVDIYFRLKDGSLTDFQPTAYIFGAKAAPGYKDAKATIRYINRIANMINNDPAVNDKMKVVFVQNYNCSYAEHIIPAADISEQISPAGKEASGTGNMKLMLNGAVTLGTLDGANVEIDQEAGRENEYIFGHTVEQFNALKKHYYPRGIYEINDRLRKAMNTLVDGTVPTDDEQRTLFDQLMNDDQYFVQMDYAPYVIAKLNANRDYADKMSFGRKCVMNILSAGKFSSDRTIRQYAKEIWHIEPTQF